MAYFSLLSATKKHFNWQLKLLRYSLQYEAKTTILATLFQVFARFSQLFSFFLPLKIILILSSNSPASFLPGSNIQIDQDVLLIGLTITTAILLILAVLFELYAKRMTYFRYKQLSQLIEKSNKASKNMQKSIGKVLEISAQGYVNIIFFTLCIIGILIVNPAIFIIVILILLIQFLITDTIFKFDKGVPGWFKRKIQREPSNYLEYLGSMNFFIVFMYLLVSYLLTGEIDSSNAILTLLLTRRIFKSIGQFASQIVKLEQKHTDLDSILVVDLVK